MFVRTSSKKIMLNFPLGSFMLNEMQDRLIPSAPAAVRLSLCAQVPIIIKQLWSFLPKTPKLQKTYFNAKIQQTKMLVTCRKFGDLFLFGLIWQYSSNHKTYNKGWFKVLATYLLAAVINFDPTYIICFVIRRES